MKDILFQFGLDDKNFTAQPFGTGLINSTWVIEDTGGEKKYILQKVNIQIFKQPGDIASNTRLIGDHLKENTPDYLFVSPVRTISGEDIFKKDDDHYRLFPFVPDSHTMDTVETAKQAYEAAKQFGRFTKLLSAFDVSQLKITLPDFHNLSLRYRQFEEALMSGNATRIEEAKNVIALVLENKTIVDQFENSRSKLKTRCTHHDTKISNILFDQNNKGLCVIDLDTVMPGYFISDLGDMMRTYLCPVSEEESDVSKIEVRKEFYDAVITGYLSEMGAELTTEEIKQVHYAGEFMIYMQAVRFLTDYLNNDAYYGAKYEGHNLVRAINQLTLLQKYKSLNPG